MNQNDIMNLIEKTSIRNMDWYYHSFIRRESNNEIISIHDQDFSDILTSGIKCRKLLHKKGKGCHNGKYYICLTKDIEGSVQMFPVYIRNYVTMIIGNIEPIKCCKHNFFKALLYNTKYTGRCGSSYDEYQIYEIIEPDKFVGIQYPLYSRIENRDRYKDALKELKNIILTMQSLNVNIPIYDYTRRNGEVVHLIDCETYLKLYEELSEDLEKEGFIKIYVPKKNI